MYRRVIRIFALSTFIRGGPAGPFIVAWLDRVMMDFELHIL